MYIDRIDINEPLGGGVVSRSFKVFDDKDFDKCITPFLDKLDEISLKNVKVANSWPVTGHGTHLIMDDKGLKAVTSWDEERGYRRIVYNRNGVVYVETTAPDRVMINGEIIELVEGSNYIEVEELTSDSDFYSSSYGTHIDAIIVKCKIPPILHEGTVWHDKVFQGTYAKAIEIYIDNTVTSLAALIKDANKLKYLNTGGWDTSNVTNMQYMFFYSLGPLRLNTTNWDTSKVTNMLSIFYFTYNLEYIDVSNWDVSKVTNFKNAFCRFGSHFGSVAPAGTIFPTIDVSKWNTTSATNMESMFEAILGGTQLIGVENLIVDKVTTMKYMFSNVWCLEELDLSSWNPVKLTNVNSMFFNYGDHKNKLKRLNISSFDPTNWTDITNMFFDCNNITHLVFPQMGKIKKAGVVFDFSYIWDLDDESIRGLFEYDRASAGLSSLNVKLPRRASTVLTAEEKAEISAKGYTLSYTNSYG